MEPDTPESDRPRVGAAGIYLPEHGDVEVVRLEGNRVCREEQDCGTRHEAGIQLGVFDPRGLTVANNEILNADDAA